jgi:fatty-acyl-CoA synthase
MNIYDFPNLIAAVDAGKGKTDKGYTFLTRDNEEQFFSWDKLRAEAMNRAAHFRARGMKAGDRLALVMPDGEDFVPTFLGAVWAGIVPVPMYPPLSLGKLDSYIDACVAIMSKSTPKFLATTSKLNAVLGSAAGRVSSLSGVITAEELRNDAPADADRSAAQVDGETTCFLQFTSGSTSAPKGVVVNHENLRANAWAIMRDGLKSDDSFDNGVSWLPLYHDMGLIGFVISPLMHGIPVTFIPTLSFVRNANIWMETINKKRGTITFAPNFAYALAAKRAKPSHLAGWDLSCIKALGCGAEPINPTTMRTFLQVFTKAGVKPEALLPCYGMAEATLAISFIGLDQEMSTDIIETDTYQAQKRAEPVHHSKLADQTAQEFVCCGRPFPGHEVGVFTDDGQPLADRRIGEIWVKGPSISKGYYLNPEATLATFGGGWLRTGDLGYMVNGNVYVSGRKKDLIIINGRNYDPQRIEWLADEIQDIRKGSTVAFTVPGESTERLVVVVESRTQTPDALIETVKQRINEQLQLTIDEVVIAAPGSLPKTSSGKLQRQKTRAQYLDGTVGKEGNRQLGGNAEKAVVAKHVALSVVGRGRVRARTVLRHASEIRSIPDAVEKLRLATSYARALPARLFA